MGRTFIFGSSATNCRTSNGLQKI